ncbi:unnamed protein product [Oppiella nova]|uniref:COMM domain-containing protein n=1 Tax=Oppiella nova TaxID=334625 RepID=A0A7R9QU16_9ACAR|nr:unnamed protein product [Oppiella nova]CAG2174912.1 unnamed protein product [Oppiella nova]
MSSCEVLMDSQSLQPLRYSSLEWRFQTQLASRAARDQLKPEVILKFELNGESDVKKYVTVVCDVSNLVHIHDVLEEALMTARSQHLLKIVRRVAKTADK